MIPFSLLHDPISGDVDLSKGLRFTADEKTYVAQRLSENLSFFLGEWFLDLREGIPYWDHIIGAKPDLGLIESLYRSAILGTPGVGAITALQIAFDRASRALSVRFTAALKDGTLISEADLTRNFVVNF